MKTDIQEVKQDIQIKEDIQEVKPDIQDIQEVKPVKLSTSGKPLAQKPDIVNEMLSEEEFLKVYEPEDNKAQTKNVVTEIKKTIDPLSTVESEFSIWDRITYGAAKGLTNVVLFGKDVYSNIFETEEEFRKSVERSAEISETLVPGENQTKVDFYKNFQTMYNNLTTAEKISYGASLGISQALTANSAEEALDIIGKDAVNNPYPMYVLTGTQMATDMATLVSGTGLVSKIPKMAKLGYLTFAGTSATKEFITSYNETKNIKDLIRSKIENEDVYGGMSEDVKWRYRGELGLEPLSENEKKYVAEQEIEEISPIKRALKNSLIDVAVNVGGAYGMDLLNDTVVKKFMKINLDSIATNTSKWFDPQRLGKMSTAVSTAAGNVAETYITEQSRNFGEYESLKVDIPIGLYVFSAATGLYAGHKYYGKVRDLYDPEKRKEIIKNSLKTTEADESYISKMTSGMPTDIAEDFMEKIRNNIDHTIEKSLEPPDYIPKEIAESLKNDYGIKEFDYVSLKETLPSEVIKLAKENMTINKEEIPSEGQNISKMIDEYNKFLDEKIKKYETDFDLEKFNEDINSSFGKFIDNYEPEILKDDIIKEHLKHIDSKIDKLKYLDNLKANINPLIKVNDDLIKRNLASKLNIFAKISDYDEVLYNGALTNIEADAIRNNKKTMELLEYDRTQKLKEAAELLNEVSGYELKNVRSYLDYMDSITRDEKIDPSEIKSLRNDFINANNISEQDIDFANKISSFFKKIRTESGYDDTDSLDYYFPRLHNDSGKKLIIEKYGNLYEDPYILSIDKNAQRKTESLLYMRDAPDPHANRLTPGVELEKGIISAINTLVNTKAQKSFDSIMFAKYGKILSFNELGGRVNENKTELEAQNNVLEKLEKVNKQTNGDIERILEIPEVLYKNIDEKLLEYTKEMLKSTITDKKIKGKEFLEQSFTNLIPEKNIESFKKIPEILKKYGDEFDSTYRGFFGTLNELTTKPNLQTKDFIEKMTNQRIENVDFKSLLGYLNNAGQKYKSMNDLKQTVNVLKYSSIFDETLYDMINRYRNISTRTSSGGGWLNRGFAKGINLLSTNLMLGTFKTAMLFRNSIQPISQGKYFIPIGEFFNPNYFKSLGLSTVEGIRSLTWKDGKPPKYEASNVVSNFVKTKKNLTPEYRRNMDKYFSENVINTQMDYLASIRDSIEESFLHDSMKKDVIDSKILKSAGNLVKDVIDSNILKSFGNLFKAGMQATDVSSRIYMFDTAHNFISKKIDSKLKQNIDDMAVRERIITEIKKDLEMHKFSRIFNANFNANINKFFETKDMNYISDIKYDYTRELIDSTLFHYDRFSQTKVNEFLKKGGKTFETIGRFSSWGINSLKNAEQVGFRELKQNILENRFTRAGKLMLGSTLIYLLSKTMLSDDEEIELRKDITLSKYIRPTLESQMFAVDPIISAFQRQDTPLGVLGSTVGMVIGTVQDKKLIDNLMNDGYTFKNAAIKTLKDKDKLFTQNLLNLIVRKQDLINLLENPDTSDAIAKTLKWSFQIPLNADEDEDFMIDSNALGVVMNLFEKTFDSNFNRLFKRTFGEIIRNATINEPEYFRLKDKDIKKDTKEQMKQIERGG